MEALTPAFPVLGTLQLTDYRVRVVNSTHGTAAKVLVLIEHRIGQRTFGTVGVSENIIEASFRALAEAVEYVVLTSGRLVRAQHRRVGRGQITIHR